MLAASFNLTLAKFPMGFIHLVRAQYFPKNYYFLPPDTHTFHSSNPLLFKGGVDLTKNPKKGGMGKFLKGRGDPKNGGIL